jgi:DNA-binding NarL/FixJ family response regulator
MRAKGTVLMGGRCAKGHGVPRVLIADNCDAVRSGIRKILEVEPNLQIVAEATDGEEAISKAITFKPDVAIVEIGLPGRDGVAVTKGIRSHRPQTEVLIFTLHEEEFRILDGLRAGARGYVLKSDPGHYLLDATKSLAAHVPYFTPKATELLIRSYRVPRRTRSRSCQDTVKTKDVLTCGEGERVAASPDPDVTHPSMAVI